MSIRRKLLITAVIACVALTGCTSRKDKAQKAIESIPEEYLEAIAEDDADRIGELVDDSGYEEGTELIRDSFPPQFTLALRAISHAEVTGISNTEIDLKNGTAKAKVTISCINLNDFNACLSSRYMTAGEQLDAMDGYEDREEYTVRVTFVYDEGDDEWRLTDNSAGKILNRLMNGIIWLPDPVEISADEAREIFEGFVEDLARGEFTDLQTEFNIEACRVYDNVTVRGSGDETREAVQRFVAAYMTYVQDHDPQITSDYPYTLILTGSAPSSEELYACLGTDEFLTEYYANFLRYSDLGWDLDDMWDDQSALIYDTLTEAIPGCSPEYYEIYGNVDPNYGNPRRSFSDHPLTVYDNVIADPGEAVYEAEHGVTQDQYMRCTEAAIELLYENGEIDAAARQRMLDSLEEQGSDWEPNGEVNSSGHPNQAVGLYEYVPSWCDDGSIVYAQSNVDENGFWMFYSKDPDNVEAANYCVDEDGIWVTCYFKNPLEFGTELLCDWWVNGDLYIDSDVYSIVERGDREVEVFLPCNGFPGEGEYEMRLWEDDHSHVLLYVTLTCD